MGGERTVDLKNKPNGRSVEEEKQDPAGKFGNRTLTEKIVKTVATTVAVTGLVLGVSRCGLDTIGMDTDAADHSDAGDVSEPDSGEDVAVPDVVTDEGPDALEITDLPDVEPDGPEAEVSDSEEADATSDEGMDAEEAESSDTEPDVLPDEGEDTEADVSDVGEETDAELDAEPDSADAETAPDAEPDVAEAETDAPLDSEEADGIFDGEVVDGVCLGEHPPASELIYLDENEWKPIGESGYGLRFTEATYTSANMELGCGVGGAVIEANASAGLGREWSIDRPAPEPDVSVTPMVYRGQLIVRAVVEETSP